MIAAADFDSSWQRLYRELQKGYEIALILGSGISSDSGFPSWPDLTASLLAKVGIDGERVKRLGMPLPALVELAQQKFKTNPDAYMAGVGEWPELVRRILYEGFFKRLADAGISAEQIHGKSRDSRVAEMIEEQNPAAAAVLELLTVKSDRHDGYSPNPRIGAVLTYNIDDLLQILDVARHGKRKIFRTIERESAGRKHKPNRINLYHLHGYLLLTRGSLQDEAPDQLVLTESEYHMRTDDAYSFANASLLWVLREFVCIFVGCSMSDELMRRSLHRSLRARKSALRAEGRDVEKDEHRWRRHFAVSCLADEDTAEDVQLRDWDLKKLGVHPLWVRNFKQDLPRRLEEAALALMPARRESERAAPTGA